MWAYNSVFYQIYPLGFVNAPYNNDHITVNRISKVNDWIKHLVALNINAVLFNPVFQSDSHGYDTSDFLKIDERLGNNEDFKQVVNNLHQFKIRVVLDGVFNHVGRNFWAFKDVLQFHENSQYCNWFFLDFKKDTVYNDGFFYEAWENHYELVKLNLQNKEVEKYLLDCVKYWIEYFKIDGLRLDVAYCLPTDFLSSLRQFTSNLKPEFFLVGEVLHGDYSKFMNEKALHSVTNYQAYKGLWSSFNSLNFFEIEHTFKQHYIDCYPNTHELNFLDNHDVTRIASMLNNFEHLKLAYGLLFAMVGMPCIYYGSEWGAVGIKGNDDHDIRKSYDVYKVNDLTIFIAKLAELFQNSKVLAYGNYHKLFLTNKQFIFERNLDKEKIIIAINADSKDYQTNFNPEINQAIDLITNKTTTLNNDMLLGKYSINYWKEIDSNKENHENNLLTNSRLNINQIDKEMASLFEKRMEEVKNVVIYKIENNLDILDQKREKIVIENNLKYLNDEEYKEYYTKFIQTLMDISKKFQQDIKDKKNK